MKAAPRSEDRYGGLGASRGTMPEAPRGLDDASGARREGAPAMSPRLAALAKELDAQPPEKWLARIQELRREGRAAEAEELLAEFKRRFPAYR
jgi:hypothetical protein